MTKKEIEESLNKVKESDRILSLKRSKRMGSAIMKIKRTEKSAFYSHIFSKNYY